VLIDDLITKGTDEPYRMFTSRAEFRLLLRQDNADQRLTPLGFDIGLADALRLKTLEDKLKHVTQLEKEFASYSVEPDSVNAILESVASAPLKQRVRLDSIITRPQVSIELLNQVPEIHEMLSSDSYTEEELDQVEINIKYAGYIERELLNVQKLQRLQDLRIPSDFDYSKVKGLSTESRQKFEKIRPVTLSQASRISGVSPSDLNVLLIFLGR
jgi:tRNA uridine 5-carboxymethylaminomethyl modification enzyme